MSKAGDPVLPPGARVHLVGGAVRDRLMGVAEGDRDWVVVGATPEQMTAAGFRPVGLDFPVFLHPRTQEEHALARTERKSGHGYHGFVFHTGADVTLEQDLARRDLTVNAMALDTDGSTVIDPWGGRADLAARVLRHVGPAFAEDPVRILRIARFAARASHAAQVQSRVKKIDKIERIEIPPEERVVKFEFAEPPRSGDDVVVMDNLAKEWQLPDGTLKPVFSGVSGIVRRGSKIALVGVNGAGKSTLLKILAGQTEPTSGSFTLGANVAAGYFSQHAMELLDPKKTIFETVQDVMPLANIGVIRNLLGAFLFSGDTVDKRIENLSGGEKSRVVLATLLARPVNLLVLDEPTNHLDIRSREILLDALKDFAGTVLLVSHDRHFLRSLVDRVFEIDHGEMRVYEGNYEYYLSKVNGEA